MIIVQTPLRVSLFGGGTDFPAFFREEGGCVLSTAIDKYVFVTIKERFDRLLRIGYTRTEMVNELDEIQHELIRESLRMVGIREGVEITTMGDIPSAGTGLGSSSAVTVGSLHAMYAFRGELVPAERLAREACQIEIDILSKPIGIQDQFIAAHGGLRFIQFQPDGTVSVERVCLDRDTQRRLSEGLMLFYTGITRQSNSILAEQQTNIRDRRPVLRRMKAMTLEALKEITAGRLENLGALLDEGWKLKKQMASLVTNGSLDLMYQAARDAGAQGGKITGAGGGGFLLLYCPQDRQDAVRAALRDLQELPFGLEADGSKVIFNYRRS
jgi:D-glycero-alpha-D-manno-heptose-7-phosphate kinase